MLYVCDRGFGFVDDLLFVFVIFVFCEEGVIVIVGVFVFLILVEILRVGLLRLWENVLLVFLVFYKGSNEIILERVVFYNYQIVFMLCSLLVIGFDCVKCKVNEFMCMFVVLDYLSDFMLLCFS